MRYHLISLGCPKNTVDAQGMARLLNAAGHIPTEEAQEADLLIVNTCGFIAEAREESLAVLQDLAADLRPGQKLVAAGCMAQYTPELLRRAIPALDGLLGTRRWNEILKLTEQIQEHTASVVLIGDPPRDAATTAQEPRIAVQGASAYLKIAEGCSAPCAFCAIPTIKGPARSRPAAEIISDARRLVAHGVKEIVLIAQDTTAYGRDQGRRDALAHLLEAILEATPSLAWLRLMYAYPQHITPRLIETMARHDQICHYLDMPLQHGHPDVLRRMRRPHDVDRVLRLIEDLRAAMPDIALRTTFIVGYPGESKAEFEALLDFVAAIAFDHVGAFPYSPEAGTPAADLPDQVPDEVKIERYERLMTLQQSISLARNQEQVGRTLEVLVEGSGDGLSVGRSYRDAPEIDGLVIVAGELPVGEMVPVSIEEAMEYDLVGRVLPEETPLERKRNPRARKVRRKG
ncbi:MAG: 30S ribosomal protein S12 methylthiotransferase RimO [Anaerolineae bacterium]|nr:30S ribosomal protein S12 methylthiotransferase RimO [Anaerolineae bacterium]